MYTLSTCKFDHESKIVNWPTETNKEKNILFKDIELIVYNENQHTMSINHFLTTLFTERVKLFPLFCFHSISQ